MKLYKLSTKNKRNTNDRRPNYKLYNIICEDCPVSRCVRYCKMQKALCPSGVISETIRCRALTTPQLAQKGNKKHIIKRRYWEKDRWWTSNGRLEYSALSTNGFCFVVSTPPPQQYYVKLEWRLFSEHILCIPWYSGVLGLVYLPNFHYSIQYSVFLSLSWPVLSQSNITAID